MANFIRGNFSVSSGVLLLEIHHRDHGAEQQNNGTANDGKCQNLTISLLLFYGETSIGHNLSSSGTHLLLSANRVESPGLSFKKNST